LNSDEIRGLIRTVEERSKTAVEMLPGTLQELNGEQGLVALDGATQPIGVNVVTDCDPGDRVMVLFVPPRGGFVVGRFATDEPESFRLVEQLRFTTVGTATFTKAEYPWLAAVRVKCQGGGGGGGGAPTTGANQVSAGSGGSGGGYAESFLLASAVGATETVTVGAGGTGVNNTNGNDGGGSSFGALLVTGGGRGGGFLAAATTNGVLAGLDGGTATVGDIRVPGDSSGGAIRIPPASMSGNGGSSVLGSSGRGGFTDTSGFDGFGFGGGGGGARRHPSNTANLKGGDGAPGIVILDLYA
jgi:hypothetical protein